MTLRNMLAEAIGTFFLCFAGIAAILSTQAPIESGAGIVGVALAHALALSVAVNAFGGVSGAHFNPAVTIGMLVVGRIKPDRAVQYILAQLAGASIAAFCCAHCFPTEAIDSAKLGIPLPGAGNVPGVDAGAWLTTPVLLGLEFIATFLLMTAIFGTAVDERGAAVKIGGFGIGLTVAFDILAIGAVTGASMNPARSFGPALVYKLLGHGDAFQLHWCYWAAPIAGAVAAALIYENLILGKE
jgi:aquaporin Z